MLTVAADAGVDLAELEMVRRGLERDGVRYRAALLADRSEANRALVLRFAIERAVNLLAGAFKQLAAHVDGDHQGGDHVRQ
jgi:hypothetical protein